jgi:hypothetical protein
VGRRTEQRIPVPHHRPVLQPPQRVRLAVVHDHDHRETRCRAFARQRDREEVGKLGGETGLLHSGTLWARRESTAVRRYGTVDCSGLANKIRRHRSSSPRTHPVRSPWPCPRTRAAARPGSQHAVEGLPARIRVRIQALTLLKGP